jgi:hypothetical protein
MPDIDDISPGDELDADTSVTCCGGVMDTVGLTWTCHRCHAVIKTSGGLIYDIRD